MKLDVKSIVLRTVALVAAAGLTACSDSSSETAAPDPELVEIQLNGNLSGSVVAETSELPESRAVIDNKHAQPVPLNFVRLDMDRTTGNYPAYSSVTSVLSAELAASSDGSASAITFTTKPEYYLVGQTNNKTKLVGWHPVVSNDESNKITYSDGVVMIPVNGENDIMLAAEQEGNKDDAFDPFTFEHKLTQIKIKAYAVNEGAKTVWGNIKTITLKKQKPTCKITLPSTTVAFEGTADDLKLVGKSASNDAELTYPLALVVGTADVENGPITNAIECGYAMIEPIKSATDGGTRLEIEIEMANGHKEPLTINWDGGYAASNAYTITLKFTATKIEPTATISEWTPFDWSTAGGSFNGEIEL